MFLCYNLPNGDEKRFSLEKSKITLGRGLNVDLTVQDRLSSRLHCSIEFKDNAWHIRDLQSRNGTFVNGQRIQESVLKPGDRISIGETVLVCEKEFSKGTETVIMELKDEMDGGKGFKTMLLEIVGDDKKDRKSKTDRIIS
jgi:pSer/pThr/pTyr-binding forkhead associated (FHA) protein